MPKGETNTTQEKARRGRALAPPALGDDEQGIAVQHPDHPKLGKAPHAVPPYRRALSVTGDSNDPDLVDQDLAEEIQLLGEIMGATTDHEGPLPNQDVDNALGL